MKQRGFTVIELIVVIIALSAIGAVVWTQFSSIESARRDDTRRTAINAMYYNLEDIFYAKNNYYPKTLSETNLTAMDKALFTDPNGKKIGIAGSSYSYDPTNCSEDKCTGYTLRAQLEDEAPFIKNNRH